MQNKDIVAKKLLSIQPDLFGNCKFCDVKLLTYKTDSQKRKFCSPECLKHWQKRPQEKTTIEKRIKNTDQTKKESRRQETMLGRYGTLSHVPDPDSRSQKISMKLKNVGHTKEHHIKVIESKRKNGTLKHSEKTKDKIKQKQLEYWTNNSIDHACTIGKVSTSNKLGYKTGTFNGIFYRSSYELLFLQICNKHNIRVISAETKEFRLKYYKENKIKYYYPDFYLPDYNLICEIKPLSMLDFDNNLDKIHLGCSEYSFWIVTEDELMEEETFLEAIYSNEHILPR